MIGTVFDFLKDGLNAYLDLVSGAHPDGAAGAWVVFPDGTHADAEAFKLGAVSALLINVEEEKILRPADRYVGRSNGGTQAVQPEVRLNLYILFVARFGNYAEGLNHLSGVIQYFQGHRVFDHLNAPALTEDVAQLTMELVTLPLAEQSEVWKALRSMYYPSVLYKVRMVVFQGDGDPVTGRITEKAIAAMP